MDNFDVHEWNKNRYLNRIEESDDPKLGGELEAGVEGDRVEENKSQLEFLAQYLNSTHPELTWEVEFGERIEAYGSAQDLANFGRKYHGKKFGEYEVFHIDDDDRLDIVRIVKSDSIMRGKNLNEASYMYKGYEDKHFDICPVAETLRDELLAGKFKDNTWATGTNFEAELGEWRYQHDVLFKTEKQVLQDKEGDERDVKKAKVAIDRIVNLSRDLGIPADRLDYLKAHLKKITDIVEYSSLTEKDEFAGSDPKAGSTIQGTGFMAPRQKPKVTQRDIDDIEASGNIDIAYNKAMDLLKTMMGRDIKGLEKLTEKEAIKETIKFIMDNLQGYSNYFPGGKTKGLSSDEMSTILMQIAKDIEDDGMQLDESKLCKRGRDYIAARKRAGEKSSAYLSGRAVKVCKGQIKGTKGKKRKDYKGNK